MSTKTITSRLALLATGTAVCLAVVLYATNGNAQATAKPEPNAKDAKAQKEPFVVTPDDLVPGMFYIGLQVFAFDEKDATALRDGGAVSKAALMGLQETGKANPVGTVSAMMMTGQETATKSVEEIIYPSEFRITENGALEALNFTMRETGVILQVIPEMGEPPMADRSRLQLTPKWIALERWEEFPTGPQTLPFRQPVFTTMSLETSILVRNGETVLLGTHSTVDGKRVYAMFLTTRWLADPPPPAQ